MRLRRAPPPRPARKRSPLYAGKFPSWLAVALLVASCNGEDKDAVAETDTDGPALADCADSALTWTNFGEGFVTNWCTGCHSESVEEARRQGAPLDINFDTYEQVAQWSSRIDARVGADSAPMPPADGIPTYEEDDLHEWMRCGLPGGTTPVVDVCDQPRAAFAGDVVVTSAGPDPAFCDTYNAIDGSLTVEGGSATALSACLCDVTGDVTFSASAVDTTELAKLRAIGGDLDVSGTSALQAVRLPALVSVGGTVTVDGNTALVDLYVDELETVGGPISVTDNPALEGIGLGKVTAIPAGDLTVTGNDAALYLEVYRLATVDGDILVADNAEMFNLVGTDGLATVGGDVRISDLPALTQLSNFEYIEDVGGDIELTGLGLAGTPFQLLGWATITAHTGSIRIVGNPGIDEIKAFPNLVDLGGELIVADNGVLEEMDDGFLALEIVGSEEDPAVSSVVIARNAKLTTYSGLYGLEIVGGLVIEGNPSLTSAAGFGALRTIFGDLRIVDNDDVTGLLGYLALDVIGGELVVAGNKDLVAVDGFDGVTSLGGLVIDDQPELTLVSLEGLTTITGDLRVLGNSSLITAPALPALLTVNGTVEVDGNALLTDLSPWYGIDAIGGDLRVTDNPSLPTASAQALADTATVGGTTVISGNAP